VRTKVNWTAPSLNKGQMANGPMEGKTLRKKVFKTTVENAIRNVSNRSRQRDI